MTTGQQKPALSERLRANMAQAEADQSALLRAELTRFSAHIRNSLSAAEATISADMARFGAEGSRSVSKRMEEIDRSLKRMSRITAWPLIFLILLILIICVASSGAGLIMARRILAETQMIESESLKGMGIYRHETPQGQLLIFSAKEATVIPCPFGKAELTCIRLER